MLLKLMFQHNSDMNVILISNVFLINVLNKVFIEIKFN